MCSVVDTVVIIRNTICHQYYKLHIFCVLLSKSKKHDVVQDMKQIYIYLAYCVLLRYDIIKNEIKF